MSRMLRRFSSWIASSSSKGASKKEHDIDVEALFLDHRVQQILRKLTGLAPTKVFRFRQFPGDPERPSYRLMTQEEFEEAEQRVAERAKHRLQIPPFKEARLAESRVIANDPEIAGIENAKLVFYDISPGLNPRERVTVVRENDGVLRTGTGAERDRMYRTYFPLSDRPVFEPQLFDEPRLTEALRDTKYEFLLDYAAWYFEPDDPKYIKVVSKVYDNCDSASMHEALWSTRHYGALVFYFVINTRVDNLLVALLNKRKLVESADVVRLYRLCHKDCKTADAKSDLDLVKNFVKSDCKNKQLGNVVQAFEEARDREAQQPVEEEQPIKVKSA